MQGEKPLGLPNSCLWAVWAVAFLASVVLVQWQWCGGLHCFAGDFLTANMAFEGILLAAVALSVQKTENTIFSRVAANHKTITFLVLLILFSAGASGFAFLHPTQTDSGWKVCIGLTPGSGLITLFSFFSFVWTLWTWGLLLLSSMVHELKMRKQRNC